MILRELFAKLGLDVDAQAFAKGNLAVEGIKFGLGKLVEVAGATVEKFVEVVQGTAESAEKLEGLAQATGMTTTELQQLGKAAAVEGMGIDDFSHSLILLARNMSAAKEGSKEQQSAFHKTGVAISGAGGKLRSAGDVFEDLADHFSKMPDGVEKTALSMKFFGRSGAGMIQVLNNGRESIEGFRKSQVMTPEQIDAGKQMILVQRQLAAQTSMLWKSAVAPLLPAITGLLKQYLAWRKANAEVMKQRITSVLGYAVKAIGLLGRGLRAVITTIEFFSKNWKMLGVIFGIVATALILANTGVIASFLATAAAAGWAALQTAAAWALAAAPFVLLAGLLAGIMLIFDDLRVYAKGGDSLFGRFEKQIKQWANSASDTDPWWLRAIKELVGYIHEAIQGIRELDEALGRNRAGDIDRRAGKNKAQLQADTDRQTLDAARTRARAGLALTDSERGALARAKVPEGAFVAKYNAEGQQQRASQQAFEQQSPMAMYHPPAAGSGVLAAPATVNQWNITQLPGENGEQLAQRIGQIVDEKRAADNEATAAALGQ